MARKLDSLAERKAQLIARCDATRLEFILESQVLHRRTRWIDTGYQVARAVAPHVKLLSPIAGLLLAGNLSRAPRLFGAIQSAWQLGRQVMPFVRGFRAGQGRA